MFLGTDPEFTMMNRLPLLGNTVISIFYLKYKKKQKKCVENNVQGAHGYIIFGFGKLKILAVPSVMRNLLNFFFP